MDYRIRTLSQLRPILKGFRKAAGMTQAVMASHLGVTQQTYAQLEASPASVSVERLFKVLRILGVGLTLVPPAALAQDGASALVAQTALADTDVSKPAARRKGKSPDTADGRRNLANTDQDPQQPAAVIKKRERW